MEKTIKQLDQVYQLFFDEMKKQNKNVTKIFTIDPETKIETLLWTR